MLLQFQQSVREKLHLKNSALYYTNKQKNRLLLTEHMRGILISYNPKAVNVKFLWTN